jgi:hypothetical protein
MALGCSPYHRVLALFAFGGFHHFIWITNAAAVDNSLQLSISAQAVGLGSFYPSAKNMLLGTFLPIIRARWQSRRWSIAFRPLCSWLPQPVYSMFSSQLKRREKGPVASLKSTASIVDMYRQTPILRHPFFRKQCFSLKYVLGTPLKIFGGMSKFRIYVKIKSSLSKHVITCI